MKILIVSDTHGRDEHLDEVLIQETPFDMLVHCGDVEGSEDYIEVVAECPVVIVAGNNDYGSDLLMEDRFAAGGHQFLVTHGHAYGVSWDLEHLADTAAERGCDVVLFGHTHRPTVETLDGVLCINPGSLTYPRQKGRKPSYAVLEIDAEGELHPEIYYLD